MMTDSQIEALYPPEGEHLHVSGWDMHHVTRGQGPKVLLIHGAGGSTRDMTFRLLPSLEGSARVTSIDRPGHGWTRGTAEDLAINPIEQAALIWKFCDVAGIDNPIICGQSFGGAIALAMTMIEPGRARHLHVISGASGSDIPKASQGVEMLTRLDMIRNVTLATVTSERFMLAAIERLFAPEPIPAGYWDWFGPRMSFRECHFRHQMQQLASLSDTLARMESHYEGIETPTTIVHGKSDLILSARDHGERLASRMPGARAVLIDGVGHMPHQTRTNLVSDLILESVR